MFQMKKKVDLDQTDTLIGQESSIEGRLRSQASIRIEGQIKGDIECAGDCIIGEKGFAESNIRARNVSIAGKVNGDVYAEEKLTILSSGSLLGDSHARTLMIEEGGTFNGSSNMNGAKELNSEIDKANSEIHKKEHKEANQELHKEVKAT